MMKPAFLTRTDTAKRIGLSYATFCRRLPDLRKVGFPDVDPVLDRYVAADIEAWISSRSKNKNCDKITGDPMEVKFDAL